MGSFSTPSAAYLVAVTSPITLPIVRKMSGKVSTATSSPKGATGTPIDTASGAIEVTKLIEPGRLPDESAAAIATARPIAISHGGRSMPPSQATPMKPTGITRGLVDGQKAPE